jgi:hypothetical protein
MMAKSMWSACLVSAIMGIAAQPVWAQESQSTTLAKRLAAAMDAAKLDSLTVKDPNSPDNYVGVFYLSGSQLLVVSAKYAVPSLLDARIARREYRDAYVDLNSASEPGTRVLVEDAGANGLKALKDGGQVDAASNAGKRLTLDGDWQKQQMTNADYQKAFAAADERYSKMLSTLLKAAEDPSARVAAR